MHLVYVQVSVGIEHISNIIADFEQALKSAPVYLEWKPNIIRPVLQNGTVRKHELQHIPQSKLWCAA